ncbi:MAG: glycoside hydrolase family 3 N-terminal domain-containing protein, partial [Acutalibacteraceae bacterium]|nr:glycoside hydrolase family 3 N-terminal domain-containing protein [Acutalibacteraceae bacterium]
MNEQQLKELLDSLTLDEKIGQMFQGNGDMVGQDGAVTGKFDLKEYSETEIQNMGSILNVYGKERLRNIQREHLKHNKIPLMFMGDIIYGYREIFPICVSQACSFDPDMIEKIARIAASEATVDGLNVDFSPMVDVTRDARWGRCAEGYGEDPELTSRCAAAVVKGYQGD